MPDEMKITFQLTAREEQRLEVRVSAPGGEARGEGPMPDPALLDEIGAHDPAHIPSALVEKTGQALYGALVGEGVDEVVVDTLSDATRAKRPAQFELRFDPDQVALTRWPWEMVQNAQGQFMVRDGLVDLTRYITYPQPPPTFDRATTGLPLFRVISMPPTLPPLSANPLGIQPVETLEHATFEAFMRKLLVDRLALWGLQFDGHGALVLQCSQCDTLNDPKAPACWKCNQPLADAKPVGALAFEKNGEVNWVPTDEFGSVLYNAHVRLAMLLACETAAVGGRLMFSGLAPGLLLAGVPAVIGMQYPVLDSFANSFANEFYGALSKDGDLLSAVRIARRINMQDAWYSPALYLRRQPTLAEQAEQPIYLTRNIDTAAPARIKAGVVFLVRLWIRRPETKPLSAAKLRDELDIPKDVPVRQRKGEAEVKFEPVVGRRLRRGEVEVTLMSTGADVTPPWMKLFIDETLDAPPAIFTVRAQALGNIPLIFSVLQNGGTIHTVTHVVEAVAGQAASEVAEHSQAVDLEGEIRKPATGRLVAIMEAREEEEAAPPPPAPAETTSGSGLLGRLKDREKSSAEPPQPSPAQPSPAPRPASEDSHLFGRRTEAKEESAAKPPPAPATPPLDLADDDKAIPMGRPRDREQPPVPRMQEPPKPAAPPFDLTRTGAAHPMGETFSLAVRAYSAGEYEHAAVLLRQCVEGGLSSPEVMELLRRAEALAEQRRFGQTRSAAPPPAEPLPAFAQPGIEIEIELALASSSAQLRQGGVVQLIELAYGDDRSLAALAEERLRTIAAIDPDLHVRQAAQSYFDEQKALARQQSDELSRPEAEAQMEVARRLQEEAERARREAESEQRQLEEARRARERAPHREAPEEYLDSVLEETADSAPTAPGGAYPAGPDIEPGETRPGQPRGEPYEGTLEDTRKHTSHEEIGQEQQGYQPAQAGQAPQAPPPAASTAWPEPALGAPQPTRAARKSGGFPVWVVIGGLLLLVCLVTAMMILLAGVLGR